MPPTTAFQAVEYAVSDELLKLYALAIGGWILTFVAQPLLNSFNPISKLLGGTLLIAGTAATFVGLVAVAYKVLADSREDTAAE